MALLNETLLQEIYGLVRRRYQEFSVALGKASPQDDQGQGQDQGDGQSPLQRDLELLIQVANGEYLRGSAPKSLLRRVDLALSNLLDLLLGNALGSHAAIPDEFWHSQLGILISRVRWWLSSDDLITISNAAALAFGENTQANRMRIARAMEKGMLEWVIDPSVANPQQNRRVLRPQVERLHAQSQLAE